MSVKVSLQKVQNDLSALLEQVSATGEEFVVQRDGKDCAVIVSAKQWRRRRVAERLDGLSSAQRLSSAQQTRIEMLLATKQVRTLTAAEQRKLNDLLQECDAVMLRRAAELDKLL